MASDGLLLKDSVDFTKKPANFLLVFQIVLRQAGFFIAHADGKNIGVIQSENIFVRFIVSRKKSFRATGLPHQLRESKSFIRCVFWKKILDEDAADPPGRRNQPVYGLQDPLVSLLGVGGMAIMNRQRCAFVFNNHAFSIFIRQQPRQLILPIFDGLGKCLRRRFPSRKPSAPWLPIRKCGAA